ncbi:MAG: gluconate 2-dehydrogenase subunit 3 family protein [Rhodothermales bacterium]
MNRRESLKLLAAAPVTAGFSWTEHDASVASEKVGQIKDRSAFAPAFFTEHEWRTVKLLADLIIPKDDRSGSATDAGVPEYMDFMMIDSPNRQTPMRGGLAWIDVQCRKRYGAPFADCTAAQQTALLDDIAYPESAPEGVEHGVAFFTSFRDLTASGFWSSKMGVEDLQYMGNTFVPEWTGCPSEVLNDLGVRYED